jgi:hypothetical protein
MLSRCYRNVRNLKRNSQYHLPCLLHHPKTHPHKPRMGHPPPLYTSSKFIEMVSSSLACSVKRNKMRPGHPSHQEKVRSEVSAPLAWIHRFVLALAGLLVFGEASFAQARNPASTGTDAVSSANRAGPYLVHNGLTSSEKENILSEIRDFLWEKFESRQSAQLRTTFFTIEGEPTSYTFYTESLNDKKWCVRADILRQYPTRPHVKKQKSVQTSREYCEVFRINAVTGSRIPDDEKCDPKMYKLRLRDISKPDELTL